MSKNRFSLVQHKRRLPISRSSSAARIRTLSSSLVVPSKQFSLARIERAAWQNVTGPVLAPLTSPASMRCCMPLLSSYSLFPVRLCFVWKSVQVCCKRSDINGGDLVHIFQEDLSARRGEREAADLRPVSCNNACNESVSLPYLWGAMVGKKLLVFPRWYSQQH